MLLGFVSLRDLNSTTAVRLTLRELEKQIPFTPSFCGYCVQLESGLPAQVPLVETAQSIPTASTNSVSPPPDLRTMFQNQPTPKAAALSIERKALREQISLIVDRRSGFRKKRFGRVTKIDPLFFRGHAAFPLLSESSKLLNQFVPPSPLSQQRQQEAGALFGAQGRHGVLEMA